MYNGNLYGGSYDHYRPTNISRAIARQDEALEELIRSTRQVIKRHINYLAENLASYTQPQHSSYHQRPSSNHSSSRKKSCSHRHNNYMPPPLSLSQPPPPPPEHYYQQYQQQQYISPITPLPREYYHNPSPVHTSTSSSKTKKWLNKLLPSSYHSSHSQPQRTYSQAQQYYPHDYLTDDEVGLLDLKKKMHRSTSYPKQNTAPPLASTSSTIRPMIITASIKTDSEKIVVIDVPLDTTVVLRSMDNQNEVTMYHVNDIRILDHLFGNPVPTQAPPEKAAKKTAARNKPEPIKTSATMPDLYNRRTSINTISSSKTITPTGRSGGGGLTKYFSSLSISKEATKNGEAFNYMDSVDSTSDGINLSSREAISLNEEEDTSTVTSLSEVEEEEEEMKVKRKTMTRTQSRHRWMI